MFYSGVMIMYKKFKLDPTGSAVPNMIMQVKDKSGASINPKYIPFDESNADYQIYKEWLSEGNTPEDVVNELELLFGRFEKIFETHSMEKLKTVGDAEKVWLRIS